MKPLRPLFLALVAALSLGCAARQDEPVEVGAGNDEVIESLRAAGSDLGRPHVLEFYSYFPSREAADRAAAALKGRGFATEVDGPDDDKEWQVMAAREEMLTVARVDALEIELAQVVKSEKGNYDGWEAAVVE